MVSIKMKAYNKIFEYAEKADDLEIGGLILGKIDKFGEPIVKDAICFKQKRTRGAFELDDDDLMDFTKKASSKRLLSVIGWWHSHGRGFCCWSGDDHDTFIRLCNFFSGFCLGIVVSLGKENNFIKTRLDIKQHKTEQIVSIDNIDMSIIGVWTQPALSQKELDKLAEKVETVEEKAISRFKDCPHCGGTGLIDSLKNSWKNFLTEQSKEKKYSGKVDYSDFDNYDKDEYNEYKQYDDDGNYIG